MEKKQEHLRRFRLSGNEDRAGEKMEYSYKQKDFSRLLSTCLMLH
jgi:hypothetical protein